MGRGRVWLALATLVLLVGLPHAAEAAGGDVDERTISISSGGPVQAMGFDEDGQLWLAVLDLGLVRFDPDSGETVEFPVEGINARANLLPDGDGEMWFTLDGVSAIGHIPIDAEDETAIEQIDLDPDGTPNGLAFDQRGRLWVADEALGQLYRIDPSDGLVETFGGTSGDYALALVGEEIWTCGNRDGLRRIDADTGDIEPSVIQLDSWVCTAILAIDDDVYVGTTQAGLLRVRDGAYEVLSSSIEQLIHELVFDGSDGVWMAPGTFYSNRFQPTSELVDHLSWDIDDDEVRSTGLATGDAIGLAVAPDGDVWYAAGPVGSPAGAIAVQQIQVGPGTTEQILSAFEGVPGFSDALTAENVARTTGLTGLVVLFVMWPSTLVNSTLEAKGDQLPWRRRRGRDEPSRRPTWLRLALLLAALPLVYIAQALVFELRDTGSDLSLAETAVQALISYGVGVVVATVVMTSIDWWSFRRARAGVIFDVRSSTLPIAVGCALISALVGFQPGFVFGLIVGLQPRRPLETTVDARRVAWGAWIAAGVSLAAWVSADAFTDGSYVWLACMGIYVAGVEAVFLEMAPLQFLSGHVVWTVRVRRWLEVWAPGVFLFVLGMIAPGVHDAHVLSLWAAAVLIGTFNVGAIGFWLWGRTLAA